MVAKKERCKAKLVDVGGKAMKMGAKQGRWVAKLERYWWLRKRGVSPSEIDIGGSKRDGLLS